jgi:hypothetical protein
MFGNNLQYNLSVDGPWKQFQERDVHNGSEAAKLMYDVDTRMASKEIAFLVFEHLLRVLPDMPTTLEECGRMMETISKKNGGEKWKELVKERRKREKQVIDKIISRQQDDLAKATQKFEYAYRVNQRRT